MIWKPKERELTAEEAIALAKTELAPFWFGSPPLLAGIQKDKVIKVVPLDPEFPKQPRLIYFIDPTDFSGETALLYAKEWFHRFGPLHLESLGIFIPTYEFLKRPEAGAHLLAQFSVGFPLMLDQQDLFMTAFRVEAPPCVILLSQGKHYLKHEGRGWWENTELEIHHFLRKNDPGLSLLPVFRPSTKSTTDRIRYEFGARPRSGIPTQFPAPGFLNYGRDRRGMFGMLNDAESGSKEFEISGEWLQNDEKIITHDPDAFLRFHLSASKFSLVAEAVTQTHDTAIISVQLGNAAIYDSLAGAHLILEETGEAVVKVTQPQLYHILTQLPEDQRRITLRFPDAKRIPIALYGIRIGD